MSENSEHSPDDNETETKTMEELPNDSCKSETKLMMHQTDATLLEDEEMPTYISVSSTTRPDDSDIVNAKQLENESREADKDRSPSPYPSDDQAASSVYVLSSGEETDQHPYNDEDDEEDGFGDSDGKLMKRSVQVMKKLSWFGLSWVDGGCLYIYSIIFIVSSIIVYLFVFFVFL